MNDTLQARIIDTQTVLLGNGGGWTRLSLPWLDRDLPELMPQALGSSGVSVFDHRLKHQEKING